MNTGKNEGLVGLRLGIEGKTEYLDGVGVYSWRVNFAEWLVCLIL